MLTIDGQASTLLLIDFQTKLMPAIDDAATAVMNARRLIEAAAILGVPTFFTEQNAQRLGPTVSDLAPDPSSIVHKMTFDACPAPDLLPRMSEGHAIVVAG